MEDSERGTVKKCDPTVKLLGAVNRNNVTCFLDSVLFAMFARLDSFEAILYKNFEDEPRKRLAILLRLWVNTVRAGKLVTVGVTKQLQETLAACGWKEAALTQQQDASEAFSFITEKLELPMLTLKMHIFHTGKEDANDDHKIVKERLLEVAIPDQPAEDEGPIQLETCLESYFSNRIEVKRYLERRATLSSGRSRRRSMDSTKAQAFHIETEEVANSQPSTPSTNPSNNLPPYSLGRSASVQHRSPSIIQEYSVLENEKSLEAGAFSDCPSPALGERPRAKSFMRKEVLMPAWQFFNLIPWYTDAAPTTDEQVAAHFRSKRPVLGICLKRYLVEKEGRAVRRSTYIDIPTELQFPHFIRDDTADGVESSFTNFKLSLQSVVCHRGNSVHSGHYVSIARGSTGLGQETWLLFDDLAKDDRVKEVDIYQALKDESPYLLFYQVLPIDSDHSSLSGDDKPPSYASDQAMTPATYDSPELRPEGRSSESGELGRPSFESRSSAQAIRGRSVGWDDLKQNGHIEPNGIDKHHNEPLMDANGHLVATSAPVGIARKTSKRGRNGKLSSSVQSGDKRLSASFTRLTGMITGANRSDGVTNGEPEAAAGPSDMVNGDGVVHPATIPEESKGKKSKRGKSRDKSRSKPRARSQSKSGKPERECIVM